MTHVPWVFLAVAGMSLIAGVLNAVEASRTALQGARRSRSSDPPSSLDHRMTLYSRWFMAGKASLHLGLAWSMTSMWVDAWVNDPWQNHHLVGLVGLVLGLIGFAAGAVQSRASGRRPRTNAS